MFAYAIFGAWLVLAAKLTAGEAFDITKMDSVLFELTDKDIVRNVKPVMRGVGGGRMESREMVIPELRNSKREFRFIGDLEIGEPLPDETVFRRSVEIANPTDQVYSTVIKLTVERGSIHYLNVRNDKNSFAVACDEPYSLGASRISFHVRVPPNTKSQLFMFVAAH